MANNTKNSPVRTIDNNSAYEIVNAAYKQAVGANAIDTLTLDDFCDAGVAFESLTLSRDKFMKALIDQVVNFYTDTTYESEYRDPYYVESRRFASIVQAITVKIGDVQESHAWRDFSPTESGGTITKKTVGSYEVNPPQVETTYFTKSVSWELPIAITEEQLTDAFKSGEELRGFIDAVFVAISNKLSAHREEMNATNRNAFLANKLIYAASEGAQGIHKVNLLTEFNSQRGGTLSTVADFFKSPEALRFGAAQMNLYKKYLQKQSTLFNTKGLVKFCPADRLVLEVNTYFENALNEVALSDTFNKELVSLPNYVSTPFWQAFGTTDALASTTAAAFEQTSKIDVSVDAGDVSQSGIVALMADKYAIMHTIRQERVASQYFDIDQITLYAYQNRDQYMENLGQNAVIFTIEPVTP